MANYVHMLPTQRPRLFENLSMYSNSQAANKSVISRYVNAEGNQRDIEILVQIALLKSSPCEVRNLACAKWNKHSDYLR